MEDEDVTHVAVECLHRMNTGAAMIRWSSISVGVYGVWTWSRTEMVSSQTIEGDLKQVNLLWNLMEL